MTSRVNTLWIGPQLPVKERMCLGSWLAHGYECHLWTYEDVEGVPDGVRVRDASNVLPGPVQRYRDPRHPDSPVLHFNLFTYTFLAEHGGTVINADELCVSDRILDTSKLIISSEHAKGGFPNLAFLNAPTPSEAFAWVRDEAWRRLETYGPVWQGGVFGPSLVRDMVDRFDLWDSVFPPEVFCPLSWNQTDLFWKAPPPKLPNETMGVQLWGAALKKQGRDMDGDAHPNSLIGRWKDAYLGS